MKRILLCAVTVLGLVLSQATVYASQATGGPVAEGEILQIDTPTNARWGEKTGNLIFNASKNGTGSYRFSIHNAANGHQIYYYQAYFAADETGEQIEWGLPGEALAEMETGAYYYEVTAVGNESCGNSQACKSGILDYVRPEKQLPAPSGLKWEDVTAKWSLSGEAAVAYELEFKEDGADEWEYMAGGYDFRGEAKTVLEHSFADDMNWQGTYRYRVKALSNNIFEAVDSEWSGWSPEISSKDVIGSVAAELADLLEYSAGADEILTVLEGKNTGALAVAVQTDRAVRDVMELAEERFSAEKGISVSTEVAAELADRISEKISILGAAFNAGEQVKSMTLNVTKPTLEKEVDKQQYRNVVQINMVLDGAADMQKLKVPVRITMPIPTGVDVEGLQILHYHNDGSYETIWPHIEGGTVSFTLTSFSTFVFVNPAEEEPEPTPEPTARPTPEPDPTKEPSPMPTASPSPSGALPFTDVKAGWRYDNIKFVYERGIMTGLDGKTFQPDHALTRAQFASVIYRLAGSPAVDYEAVFTDVPSGKWFSDAVIWAYKNKIVAGLGGGVFGSEKEITREQMARMLMEFARVQKYDISETAELGSFADASQVSRWAADNVKWAVGNGIISGSVRDGKYYLNPKGQATRAECAVMLTKFIGKYQ